MAESREDLRAQLAEVVARRAQLRSDLALALVAIDTATKRIDVLLLRLARAGR